MEIPWWRSLERLTFTRTLGLSGGVGGMEVFEIQLSWDCHFFWHQDPKVQRLMKWTWYGRYPWDKLINLDELGFDEISGSPPLKPFRHSTNLGCTRGELLPLGVWRHKQLWFVKWVTILYAKATMLGHAVTFPTKRKGFQTACHCEKSAMSTWWCLRWLCWDSIWHRCGQTSFLLTPLSFLCLFCFFGLRMAICSGICKFLEHSLVLTMLPALTQLQTPVWPWTCNSKIGFRL